MESNFEEMKSKAAQWMIDRGWKTKLAKRKGFEQSLFEHTYCEIDVILTLCSIWTEARTPYRLTDDEQKVLFVSTLLHDLGKETDAWQEYILGKGAGYVSHCDEALVRSVLPQLTTLFDINEISEVLSGVLLHMRSAATEGNIFARAALGNHSNPRWKMLADLIAQLDNFCSAKGLFGGLSAIERCNFIQTLSVEYHQVNLRGLATTLLHRAALDSYVEKGWRPLMHYANGTIYAASPVNNPLPPAREDIFPRFSKLIEDIMSGKDFAQMVVGSPVATMLPKPDLFDYREIRQYLKTAARRVGRANFKKKKGADQKRVADNYLQISKAADQNKGWEFHAERIGDAHPEMIIFKFFKTALSDKLIDPATLKIDTETDRHISEKCNIDTPEGEKRYKAEIKKEQKKIWDNIQKVVSQEYEYVFGPGAFAALIGTSTLMPAKDMALTVDYFWKLPASGFKRKAIPDQVGFLRSEDREDLLIDILAGIAEKAFSVFSEENRPQRIPPRDLADQFMKDLIHPSGTIPFEKIVTDQLEAYTQSKPLAKKEKGRHLCPLCNQPFFAGTAAKSDFLDNPESHTNRAVAHSSPGHIVICDGCRYERFLEQLVLGGKPAKMLVLFPRMGITPGVGALLQKKAEQIWNQLSMVMSESNPDPSLSVSLALTSEIARKLSGKETWGLSAEEIAGLLVYKSSKVEKKRRKVLEDLLKDNISSTVDDLNTLWMSNYATWDEAVDALLRKEVQEGESLRYRAEAISQTPSLNIVCQTPHMVLIPLQNPLTFGKESDVNGGIRELFILMILGFALDCTIASTADGETIDFEGGEGVARVPDVPALRRLVGGEWIGLNEAAKWIRAIASASQLTLAADFPDRSNLYQMLMVPTVGHILRRIEQKSTPGSIAAYHLEHLKNIEPVLK